MCKKQPLNKEKKDKGHNQKLKELRKKAIKKEPKPDISLVQPKRRRGRTRFGVDDKIVFEGTDAARVDDHSNIRSIFRSLKKSIKQYPKILEYIRLQLHRAFSTKQANLYLENVIKLVSTAKSQKQTSKKNKLATCSSVDDRGTNDDEQMQHFVEENKTSPSTPAHQCSNSNQSESILFHSQSMGDLSHQHQVDCNLKLNQQQVISEEEASGRLNFLLQNYYQGRSQLSPKNNSNQCLPFSLIFDDLDNAEENKLNDQILYDMQRNLGLNQNSRLNLQFMSDYGGIFAPAIEFTTQQSEFDVIQDNAQIINQKQNQIIDYTTSQNFNNDGVVSIKRPKNSKKTPIPSKPPVVRNTFESAMYNLSKKALDLFFLDPACASVFLIMYPIMKDLNENYIIIEDDEIEQIRQYQAQQEIKKANPGENINKRKIKGRKRFSVPASIRREKNLEQLEVYRDKAIEALAKAKPLVNWRLFFNREDVNVKTLGLKVDGNGQVLTLRKLSPYRIQ